MNCCQKCESVQPLWTILWGSLKNINNRTARRPSSFTSGWPPRYKGSGNRISKRDLLSYMFAAPATTAKMGKRPTRPSAGEGPKEPGVSLRWHITRPWRGRVSCPRLGQRGWAWGTLRSVRAARHTRANTM